MKIRFSLDPQMDANLIARIEEKAGGGSVNEAAKFLMRFWYELESGQDVTATGQNLTPTGQNVSSEGKDELFDLSGLDTIIP